MQRGLDLGTGRDQVLVLLPGFVTPARSYAALVTPWSHPILAFG
jgi:hypothetical protein